MASLIERLTTRQPLTSFKNYISRLSSHSADDDCDDDSCSKHGKKNGNPNCFEGWNYYSLEDKVRQFPYLYSAADLKMRLVLSQGYEFVPKDGEVATSDEGSVKKKIEDDKVILHDIFNRQNGVSQSLNDLIASSVVETELYGHSGLQAYDWDSIETIFFQNIRWNQFLIVADKLKRRSRGRLDIAYYFVNLKGFGSEEVDLVLVEDKRGGAVKNKKSDDVYKYKVLPIEFVQFSLNADTVYGLSPLYYNVLMTQFILDILHDNLDTVNNRGWKGIVLKGKKGMKAYDFGIQSEGLETDWQNKLVTKFLKGIRTAISGQQNRDNVMFLNGNLVEDWQKMDRGFESVEYMDTVHEKASVLAASIVGILAGFLGDKNNTYAANLKEAISFAVNYSINPSQLKYESVINNKIMDRYINGGEGLNYEYKFDLNPIDLADPKVQAEVFKLVGEFVGSLRKEGFATINESVRILNDKVRDLELSELEDAVEDAGNTKTTVTPLLPINLEEIEPDRPEVDEEPEEEEDDDEEE